MNKGVSDLPPFVRIGREPLPDRRRNETVAAVWKDALGNEHKIKVTPGFYDDGRIGEVFACAAKPDSILDTMLDEWSQALSRLLQRGCPLSEIRRGIAFAADGRPETALGAVVKTLIDVEATR